MHIESEADYYFDAECVFLLSKRSEVQEVGESEE